MAIRRKCREQCGNGRQCLEHLWFDVMFRGTRYRMSANDFAIPRMEVGCGGPSSRSRRRATGSAR